MGYAKKEDAAAYLKAYRQANKARIKASQHAWYLANRARLLIAAKDYQVANKAALALARKPGNQIYRRSHKAERAASNKAWSQANPGRLNMRWAALNSGRNKANHCAWWAKHPGKRQAYGAARRAAKLHATPPWLTKAHLKQIETFYLEARRLFELDGVRRHVDHRYPLQGKTCCGLHVPWNLQILTKTENLKKQNKLPVSHKETHL